MRILVGSFAHETNTVSNVYTGISHFEALPTLVGDAIPAQVRGTRSGVGGYIDAARELGLDRVFTVFQRQVRPTLGVKRLPLLAPITRMRTGIEPMRGIVARLGAIEREPGVLSCSFVHGFPYADVPYNGAAAVVYTDDDAGLAQRSADELADRLWTQRGLLRHLPAPISAGVDEALRAERGPAVIPDVSDNPGGGATGDSVEVLRELLRRGVDRAAFGTVWDPAAVARSGRARVRSRRSASGPPRPPCPAAC